MKRIYHDVLLNAKEAHDTLHERINTHSTLQIARQLRRINLEREDKNQPQMDLPHNWLSHDSHTLGRVMKSNEFKQLNLDYPGTASVIKSRKNYIDTDNLIPKPNTPEAQGFGITGNALDSNKAVYRDELRKRHHSFVHQQVNSPHFGRHVYGIKSPLLNAKEARQVMDDKIYQDDVKIHTGINHVNNSITVDRSQFSNAEANKMFKARAENAKKVMNDLKTNNQHKISKAMHSHEFKQTDVDYPGEIRPAVHKKLEHIKLKSTLPVPGGPGFKQFHTFKDDLDNGFKTNPSEIRAALSNESKHYKQVEQSRGQAPIGGLASKIANTVKASHKMTSTPKANPSRAKPKQQANPSLSQAGGLAAKIAQSAKGLHKADPSKARTPKDPFKKAMDSSKWINTASESPNKPNQNRKDVDQAELVPPMPDTDQEPPVNHAAPEPPEMPSEDTDEAPVTPEDSSLDGKWEADKEAFKNAEPSSDYRTPQEKIKDRMAKGTAHARKVNAERKPVAKFGSIPTHGVAYGYIKDAVNKYGDYATKIAFRTNRGDTARGDTAINPHEIGGSKVFLSPNEMRGVEQSIDKRMKNPSEPSIDPKAFQKTYNGWNDSRKNVSYKEIRDPKDVVAPSNKQIDELYGKNGLKGLDRQRYAVAMDTYHAANYTHYDEVYTEPGKGYQYGSSAKHVAKVSRDLRSKMLDNITPKGKAKIKATMPKGIDSKRMAPYANGKPLNKIDTIDGHVDDKAINNDCHMNSKINRIFRHKLDPDKSIQLDKLMKPKQTAEFGSEVMSLKPSISHSKMLDNTLNHQDIYKDRSRKRQISNSQKHAHAMSSEIRHSYRSGAMKAKAKNRRLSNQQQSHHTSRHVNRGGMSR